MCQHTHTLNIKLKEEALLLSDVTVTSKKRHTNIMQQAKTLDQSILEKGGATSLAKMLESIPGVSSISAGSTVAKPVIQGMHSSRILLMNRLCNRVSRTDRTNAGNGLKEFCQ